MIFHRAQKILLYVFLVIIISSIGTQIVITQLDKTVPVGAELTLSKKVKKDLTLYFSNGEKTGTLSSAFINITVDEESSIMDKGGVVITEAPLAGEIRHTVSGDLNRFLVDGAYFNLSANGILSNVTNPFGYMELFFNQNLEPFSLTEFNKIDLIIKSMVARKIKISLIGKGESRAPCAGDEFWTEKITEGESLYSISLLPSLFPSSCKKEIAKTKESVIGLRIGFDDNKGRISSMLLKKIDIKYNKQQK